MADEAGANKEAVEAAQQLVVTLRPEAVQNNILRSVSDVLTVMRICIPAIEEADLTKLPERKFEPAAGERIPASFELSDARTPEDRKFAGVNWMLLRGFQELARAVRNALEEAHVYVAAIDHFSASPKSTWGDFQPVIATARKEAGSLRFPRLMEVVNKRLSTPLRFEKEFISFQKVRNCLEHRAGIVGQVDTGANGTLALSLPRLEIFYMRGGKEIEVRAGEPIEGDDGGGATIKMRMGTGSREFRLGQRVLFSADEFQEIGLGCWAFASDLANKLPTLEQKKET